jgi:SpoVK/Ycf46/Vps4 family AAA+-type ATPase
MKVTECFFVDLPNPIERLEILGVHLEKRKRNPDKFDLDRLVAKTKNLTGSEIEESIVEGMFRAYSEGLEVTTAHIESAATDLVPLATTMKDRIDAVRKWAETRCRMASKKLDIATTEQIDEFEAAFEGIDMNEPKGAKDAN